MHLRLGVDTAQRRYHCAIPQQPGDLRARFYAYRVAANATTPTTA